MITFGELRKKSVAWQMEIGAVEKLYALAQMMQDIVARETLYNALTLRGAPALANAYFENYPRVEDAEFARDAALTDDTLRAELEAALADAARASGLQFKLHSFSGTEARAEFTGPLGRRSAAQPLLIARFVPNAPRVAPQTRALLYPFSDAYAANARVVVLHEIAAERIVWWAQKTRARDVYDLWFVLTRSEGALDTAQTRALAQSIAAAKGIVLRAALDDAYAPVLERAWGKALREIRAHPPFAQARAEIEQALRQML